VSAFKAQAEPTVGNAAVGCELPGTGRIEVRPQLKGARFLHAAEALKSRVGSGLRAWWVHGFILRR
jgi:hypothetical protein